MHIGLRPNRVSYQAGPAPDLSPDENPRTHSAQRRASEPERRRAGDPRTVPQGRRDHRRGGAHRTDRPGAGQPSDPPGQLRGARCGPPGGLGHRGDHAPGHGHGAQPRARLLAGGPVPERPLRAVRLPRLLVAFAADGAGDAALQQHDRRRLERGAVRLRPARPGGPALPRHRLSDGIQPPARRPGRRRAQSGRPRAGAPADRSQRAHRRPARRVGHPRRTDRADLPPRGARALRLLARLTPLPAGASVLPRPPRRRPRARRRERAQRLHRRVAAARRQDRTGRRAARRHRGRPGAAVARVGRAAARAGLGAALVRAHVGGACDARRGRRRSGCTARTARR